MYLQARAALPFILFLALTSCAVERHDGSFVVDDLGRHVALPDTIRRIVTLAPNVTEIAFAAGCGERIVAVTTADDYPEEVESLPRITVLPLDLEAVLQHQPDLVLASAGANSPRDAESLEAYGAAVYFLSFDSVADIIDAVETIGEVVGTRATASRTADVLRARLREEHHPEGPAERHPAVLFLIGLETLYSFGGDSYVNEMITIAGGRSITRELSSRAPVLSDEFVLERAPDVIIGTFPGETSPESLLRVRPSWASVPAVRNSRVYALDPDLVLRPGPRVVDGIAEMRAIFAAVEGEPRD